MRKRRGSRGGWMDLRTLAPRPSLGANMALIVRGMSCALCREPLHDGREIAAMTAFIANQADELYIFNDAAFHRACLESHPLREKALKRYEDVRAFSRAERICAHCAAPIDPDHLLAIGHLTDDASDPLFEFNYTVLDERHLLEWDKYSRFEELVGAFQNSSRYLGYYPIVPGRPFRAAPDKIGKSYKIRRTR